MDCVSVHRGSSHLQLHSHGCWEREKAWAADGAGSVMPAALATGGLFCDWWHCVLCHLPDLQEPPSWPWERKVPLLCDGKYSLVGSELAELVGPEHPIPGA